MDVGNTTEARLDWRKVAPEAGEGLAVLGKFSQGGTLETALLELVKVRASQINGCAYCLDMHSKDARAMGESEERLHMLAAWHEAPCYSERERAALAWTEALTLVHEGHAPDEVYEEVRRHFTEREIVELTIAIVAINGWNRLGIGFRTPAGRYRPRAASAEARATR